MNNPEIKPAIEAILFAAGEPVSAERLAQILGCDTAKIFKIAKQIGDEYSFQRRGIRLVRTEHSLQMCSAPEFADDIIHTLEKRKPPKLSQPALEVLSICAYFQPVTRSYVDQIRGVDSSYTMGMLLERGLIEACGKLDVPGRPTIYKTSSVFLRTMGITDLTQLPKLPELGADDSQSKLKDVIEAMKENDRAKDCGNSEHISNTNIS